jgi:hypothetical protein
VTSVSLKTTTGNVIACGLVILAAVRTALLFIRYETGVPTVSRYHVESAALLLVVIGAIVRLLRQVDDANPASHVSAGSLAEWLVWIGLALALYWPAQTVGFLSDDVILRDHAAAWQLGPVTRDLFRPVPLLAWSTLIAMGGGARILHLLNIVLHGTNAYLGGRVVGGWIPGRAWVRPASLLILAAPLAPEAVAWTAGIFDLSATALILATILVSRGYDGRTSLWRRVAFICLGLAAFLSKETAAVVPALVFLDAWLRGSMTRPLAKDAGVLLAAIGLVSVVRLVTRFGVVSPLLGKYVVQRGVFSVFGALAVPWHEEVTRAWIVLPVASGLIAIAAFTVWSCLRGSRASTRVVAGGAVWLLLSILPVLPLVTIQSDLQASRYLYLPFVGWTAVVCAVASEFERRHARLGLAFVVLLAVLGSVAARMHLRPWIDAASLRDTVLRAAAANGRLRECKESEIADLPDSVSGAYVFRNGAREAFANGVGLRITAVTSTTTGPCSFRWDEARLSFVPE